MATAAQMNRDNPLLNDPATDSNLDWDGQQDQPADTATDEAAQAAATQADTANKAAEDATKAVEDAAKAEKSNKPPEGFVAHGALHEERRRRQALEADIKAMNDRFAQVLDSVSKISVPRETATPARTSFDDDPLAYLKSELDTTRAKLAELEQERTVRAKSSEETTRQQQFYRNVAVQVAQYRREHPDYEQAYNFMAQKRLDDLDALGVPPDQAAAVLDAEQQWLAATALEQGKNPGEVVYTMAQRWGYKASAKEAAQAEADKLKQIEDGQNRAKSLANAGGTPSLQDLSRLGDDEFDAALKELGLK